MIVLISYSTIGTMIQFNVCPTIQLALFLPVAPLMTSVCGVLSRRMSKNTESVHECVLVLGMMMEPC
jgi:hypothetical protein